MRPIDASDILTGMTWDSREVEPGDLFVALAGERVDGHRFISAALNAGAMGVLVNEAPDSATCLLAQELGAAIIEGPNTYHAIEDLASGWRDLINARVVAITGSVGKTTTKNLVRDVCSARFRTVATKANQNNELGVPNTILQAQPDTQVVIVEMGMRGAGQIAKLCQIARPEWGIITNIGDSHMELLGSKDAIARAKGELLCALPDGVGKAVLNADDEYTPKLISDENLRQRRVEIIEYGSDEGVERAQSEGIEYGGCWFENLAVDEEGRPSFDICCSGFVDEDPQNDNPTLFDIEPDARRVNCKLSIRGAHNASNACAAASIGLSLGMSLEEIAASLSASLPESGRLQTYTGRDGFKVIDDSYNANPDSMRAALRMLHDMEVQGRRIAVLGDMGELGPVERECHRGVGREAAASGLDALICIGEMASEIASSAIDSGMEESRVTHVSSIAEALGILEGDLFEEDVVLVKASRFMNLDRLAEGLVS